MSRGIVYRLVLPLMWPALVATAILAFIAARNEFLFALTFTPSNDMRAVPIALITGARPQELIWGYIMAASVIVTIPPLVLIIQSKIMSGLTARAVKG